nr:MAG TPA: distal tail protein [Caudoviricetes sp.]
MDINIDGTISTYNKDDPRGIHVGHSIYFADSYDDIINKYTNGKSEDPKPVETIDSSALIGVKNYSISINGELQEALSTDKYWNNGEALITGGKFKINFYDTPYLPVSNDRFELTASDGPAVVNIEYGLIKSISFIKDASIKPDSEVNLKNIPSIFPAYPRAYYISQLVGFSNNQATSLKNYYMSSDSKHLVCECYVSLMPIHDSNVFMDTATGPTMMNLNQSITGSDVWFRAFNKVRLLRYKSSSNAERIDLSDLYIGLMVGYDIGGELPSTIPDLSEIKWHLRVLSDDELYNTFYKPDNITVDNFLYANMTYVNDDDATNSGSNKVYDLSTGIGAQASSNPFYNSISGDNIFPAGVKLTLSIEKYIHYIHPILINRYSSTGPGYRISHVAIDGMHFTLNGSINYENDSTLASQLHQSGANTSYPWIYSLLGVPKGVSETRKYDTNEVKTVKAGHGLIIYIDDANGSFPSNDLFDISVTVTWKGDTSYMYTCTPRNIMFSSISNGQYVYLSYRELFGTDISSKNDTDEIDIYNILLSFGTNNTNNGSFSAECMTATNRTGIVFNNFKFSIYSGPDPSISTQSINEEINIPAVMAAPLIKTSAIQTYSETQLNQFLNLLPRGCYNTWDDFHLIPTSRPVIAPPSVKTNTIDLPGGNGVLDLSYSLTKCPLYDNRKGSLEFIVDSDQDTWINVYQKLSNYLDGRYRYMTLEDDPYWVYEGKFMVNDWQSDEHWSTITIDYDVKPYKRYILKTDPDQSLSTGRTKIPYYDELKSTFMGIGALSIDNPEKVLLNIDLYSTIPVCPSFTVRFGAVRITITRIENQVYIDEPISVSQKLGNHVKIISTYDTEKPKDVYNPIYVNDLSLMFQGQCTLQVQALDNTVIPQVDVIFRPGIL